MEIADVQQVWFRDEAGSSLSTVACEKAGRRRERDRDPRRRNAIRRVISAAENVESVSRVPPNAHCGDRTRGAPIRRYGYHSDACVADVVNVSTTGTRSRTARYRRRVNQIDAGLCGSAWQADQRPAKVRRWMRRLGQVADAAGQRARICAAERDDLGGILEPRERTRETFDIPPDTGSGRAESPTVESHPQSVDDGRSMIICDLNLIVNREFHL